MDWRAEIIELHDFFQEWFDGSTDSTERMTVVLADSFSLVGPGGETFDRAGIVDLVTAGHGRGGMTLGTEGHELLWESPDAVVARYVETHTTADTSTRRISTAVFERHPAAPNGLRWVSVHETWTD